MRTNLLKDIACEKQLGLASLSPLNSRRNRLASRLLSLLNISFPWFSSGKGTQFCVSRPRFFETGLIEAALTGREFIRDG